MSEEPELMERRWGLPMYFIGTKDGQSGLLTEYEGLLCGLLYQQLELAELYASQSAELGAPDVAAIPLRTAEELAQWLKTMHRSGAGHMILDAPIRPTVAMMIETSEILRAIGAE